MFRNRWKIYELLGERDSQEEKKEVSILVITFCVCVKTKNNIKKVIFLILFYTTQKILIKNFFFCECSVKILGQIGVRVRYMS